MSLLGILHARFATFVNFQERVAHGYNDVEVSWQRQSLVCIAVFAVQCIGARVPLAVVALSRLLHLAPTPFANL